MAILLGAFFGVLAGIFVSLLYAAVVALMTAKQHPDLTQQEHFQMGVMLGRKIRPWTWTPCIIIGMCVGYFYFS